MLLPIKLLCDRRARKDGTNAICIQYCYRPDKRTLLNTEIYIPSRYWNSKLSRISNQLPEIHDNTELLNERLGLMLRMAEDIISFAKKRNIDDPISFLKKIFHPNFDTASLEDIAMEAGSVKAIIKLTWMKYFLIFRLSNTINFVQYGSLKVAVKRKKAFGAFYLFTTGSLLTEPLFCLKIGSTSFNRSICPI